MTAKTKIEWTDATWNPILGCSRVSEGCRHCYAETIAGRFAQGKPSVYSGLAVIANGHAQWTGKIVETRQLLEPLHWRKPRRVFVNSMSDLFHENVTDDMRDRIFAVMALAHQHTFQILTKRPAAMLDYVTSLRAGSRNVSVAGAQILSKSSDPDDVEYSRALDRMATLSFQWSPGMLKNVWLGVSVENQATADERIPLLLQTPAAVRFISAEPLLGWINLEELPSASGIGRHLDALSNAGVDGGALIATKLDWVICGGESGRDARPMHPDWARSLRDQCAAAGVPFFFKQWGAWASVSEVEGAGEHHRFPNGATVRRVGKKKAGALLAGVEWKQFPKEQP